MQLVIFNKTELLYIKISINENICFASLLTAACKYARDKKMQEKQKKLNSLPPILRPKTKKSRELAAVANFQHKIRPRRPVDTDKYNRKQWARTDVAMNPFLYGKKYELTELTMVRQSPLKTLQSNDHPEEGLDGAFPFPQSLSDTFGESSDVTDAGPVMPGDRELHFGQGVLNGVQNQERDDAEATASGLAKPKKVWAKKNLADRKADKAKKKSSSKSH